MNTSTLTGPQKKDLRKIAHHLKPIITLTSVSFSDGALKETIRALGDHELIKLKIDDADKIGREQIIIRIVDLTESDLIQTIGKCIILYKKTSKSDPKLSNISRFTFPKT